MTCEAPKFIGMVCRKKQEGEPGFCQALSVAPDLSPADAVKALANEPENFKGCDFSDKVREVLKAKITN